MFILLAEQSKLELVTPDPLLDLGQPVLLGLLAEVVLNIDVNGDDLRDKDCRYGFKYCKSYCTVESVSE